MIYYKLLPVAVPDECIGTIGYLVINLASLTQSLSSHLREGMEEAEATDGKGRSTVPTKADSTGMLLEGIAVQVLGEVR